MYLLFVIKGQKTAQANIGVKFAGNPTNLARIKQSNNSQQDFKISVI